jgi:SpoVK/Ycf46/Vps4 family AAA+-type ATPase
MSNKKQDLMLTNEVRKIKIFVISISRTETKNTELNPEYQVWKEKYDQLSGLLKSESNEVNTITTIPAEKEVLANLIKDAPSSTVTRIDIQRNIKCEQINEAYKDFSTMYLSKSDKRQLMSILYNFKHKQDLLQKLGLPNKLGILLSGPPGVGKSSAITTIASYLQKDIYYLNLSGVKTNQELSMLFDHIVKMNQNSGIIVMEDIDAMTTVVHKRIEGDFRALTTTELINSNESPLSLEYFLNILQGSLTRDGTIFITTTNHLEMLDPAFYRDGRFDVKIDMKCADHFQISNIFEVFFGRKPNESLIQQIPAYKYAPATFITHFSQFIMDDEVSDDVILNRFL